MNQLTHTHTRAHATRITRTHTAHRHTPTHAHTTRAAPERGGPDLRPSQGRAGANYLRKQGPPAPPHLPPSTRAHSACRPELEKAGRGGGADREAGGGGTRVGPLNSIPGAVSSLRLAQAADYLRKQGAPCIAAALLGTSP